MGFLSDSQADSAQTVYNSARSLLRRDGKTHIIMFNSFSKWLNKNFGCETKYTTQIDEILTCMQNDGFDIIDVKFNSLMNQGLWGEMEGFHTLITYRSNAPGENKHTPYPQALQSQSIQIEDEKTARLVLRNDLYCCTLCGQPQRSTRNLCQNCGAHFENAGEFPDNYNNL